MYNNRLAKFPSRDFLAWKYPGYSPYSFAMNRPIDGYDNNGLEWVQFNKTNIGTIVFGYDNIYGEKPDPAIQIQFRNAQQSRMNIIVAKDFNELLSDFQDGRLTVAQNLIFGNHGYSWADKLNFFDGGYDVPKLKKSALEIQKLGKYVNNVVSLGCFDGAPDGPTFHHKPQYGLIYKTNTRAYFTSLINKPFYTNGGYGPNFTGMFNEGSFLTQGNSNSEPDYLNRMNKQYNGWRVDNPNGTTNTFESLGVREDGSIQVIDFKKAYNEIKGAVQKGIQKLQNATSGSGRKSIQRL